MTIETGLTTYTGQIISAEVCVKESEADRIHQIEIEHVVSIHGTNADFSCLRGLQKLNLRNGTEFYYKPDKAKGFIALSVPGIKMPIDIKLSEIHRFKWNAK